MDAYNRAYRDPKSPLTPLTPLSSLKVFDFTQQENTNAKANTHAVKNERKFTPSNPRRHADHFLQIRNVFEESKKPASPKQNEDASSTKVLNFEGIPPPPIPTNSTIYKYYKEQGFIPDMAQQCYPKLSPSSVEQYKRETKAETDAIERLCYKYRRFLDHYPRGNNKSPIHERPLSPRTRNILKRFDMEKFNELFRREEIDVSIMRTMTKADLEELGIYDSIDQKIMLRAFEFTAEFY